MTCVSKQKASCGYEIFRKGRTIAESRLVCLKKLVWSEAESDGPALETLFLQEAKAINEYFDLGYTICFWRTQNKDEVDFILYGEKGLYAFEIKRKANLSPHDFKALKLFQEDYPMAKLYLLYGGNQSYSEGNIRVESFAKFITKLKQVLNNEQLS